MSILGGVDRPPALLLLSVTEKFSERIPEFLGRGFLSMPPVRRHEHRVFDDLTLNPPALGPVDGHGVKLRHRDAELNIQ